MQNNRSIILAVYSAALAKLNACRSLLAGSEGRSEMSLLENHLRVACRMVNSDVRQTADMLDKLSARCGLSVEIETAALRETLMPWGGACTPENIPAPCPPYTDEATRRQQYYAGVPVRSDLFSDEATLLHNRIAKLEARENVLAELYQKINECELRLKFETSKVQERRKAQFAQRAALRLLGRPVPQTTTSWLRDDPEYAAALKEVKALYDQVRQIRAQPLSA